MSIRTRIFSLAAMAALFAAFGTLVFAQDTGTGNQDGMRQGDRRNRKADKRDNDRPGPDGGVDLRGLNLTDEQKAQLRTIREANRPDPGTVQETRTLIQARRSGTITPEQETRLNELQTQARERAQNVRTQVEGVLTPEQLQTVQNRREHRQERREERRERRGGDGTSTDGARRQPGARGETSPGGRAPSTGAPSPGVRRQGRP